VVVGCRFLLACISCRRPSTAFCGSVVISDVHGSEDPRGSMGMGIMGMGVGDYIFTHTKPIPIAAGAWV
jgi:hypothetical protein